MMDIKAKRGLNRIVQASFVFEGKLTNEIPQLPSQNNRNRYQFWNGRESLSIFNP
jgi:hypothetical protein